MCTDWRTIDDFHHNFVDGGTRYIKKCTEYRCSDENNEEACKKFLSETKFVNSTCQTCRDKDFCNKQTDMGRDPLKGEMRSKDNVTGSGGGDGLPDCPLKWGQSVGKSHPFAIIESDLSSYHKINFLEWRGGGVYNSYCTRAFRLAEVARIEPAHSDLKADADNQT